MVNQSVIEIGRADGLNAESKDQVEEVLNALKPWRKGPWNIFGTHINSEWQSDMKWERIKKHMPKLKGKVVCDVGCGNGYFCIECYTKTLNFLSAWIQICMHGWSTKYSSTLQELRI